jgi:hypothetical protein
MRIALIVVLGFCAVFVWTLIAAQGNESPSLRSTHFCGTWRPHGKSPGRHVVYARDMSCPRARMVAADYSRTRTCPVTSMSCLAHVDRLKCFTKGTAGRRLIWIGCEHPEGKPPRAVFSVDRVR